MVNAIEAERLIVEAERNGATHFYSFSAPPQHDDQQAMLRPAPLTAEDIRRFASRMAAGGEVRASRVENGVVLIAPSPLAA